MIKDQSGQIIILAFIALGVMLFTVLFIIGGAQLYFQNASYSANAEKAIAIAEAGVDKAIASLNKTGGSYTDESTILGDGAYSVTVTNKDAITKVIESTGFIPDKNNPKVKRTVKINALRGTGVSFNYGLQVGEGGLELGNGNIIKGSIYSNGSIIMGNVNEITGDAWVAAGVSPTANQQADCQVCAEFVFGKIIDGQTRLDIAQSFKPSITDKIRKVALKVKKTGPGPHADPIVRIMGDDNGKPKRNEVLATGVLNNLLVTGDPGFIDVTFFTNPTLIAETTYWIMIDTSANNTNYWVWQNDTAASYNRGQPKWSADWGAGNPVWNDLTGGPNLNDFSFNIYMGGTINSITSGNNSKVLGDVHANTINGLTIQKEAYYQAIANSTVGGSACPNPKCHPGSEDPAPQAFPISEANINSWKSGAESAGPLPSPTCGSPVAWGPGKYSGNLILGSSCSIKVKTPVWITGNLTLENGNSFILDSSYGSTSGVIILGTDGTQGYATMGNQNKILGTGEGSSILVLLTTYDSRVNQQTAITIGNVGNSGGFYADKGIIDPGNSNKFKELTAWKITLTNDSIIDYETGLASTLFSSGPQGSYSLVKGTYQVK